MSELDPRRRDLLAELLRAEGQALLTTTDVEHVPGAHLDDVRVLEVARAPGRSRRRNARGVAA
jgi:DNA replication and repair protein RecF